MVMSDPKRPDMSLGMNSVPQAQAIGLEMISVSPGRGVMRVPFREDLVGDPATGVIAGGVVTTLLDHCGGMAVGSAAVKGTEGSFSTATLDLRIDYMRPAAPGASVTAEAHCYKHTHAIGFVRAIAHDGDPDDPVATAQAAFFLNRATAR